MVFLFNFFHHPLFLDVFLVWSHFVFSISLVFIFFILLHPHFFSLFISFVPLLRLGIRMGLISGLSLILCRSHFYEPTYITTVGISRFKSPRGDCVNNNWTLMYDVLSCSYSKTAASSCMNHSCHCSGWSCSTPESSDRPSSQLHKGLRYKQDLRKVVSHHSSTLKCKLQPVCNVPVLYLHYIRSTLAQTRRIG